MADVRRTVITKYREEVRTVPYTVPVVELTMTEEEARAVARRLAQNGAWELDEYGVLFATLVRDLYPGGGYTSPEMVESGKAQRVAQSRGNR